MCLTMLLLNFLKQRLPDRQGLIGACLHKLVPLASRVVDPTLPEAPRKVRLNSLTLQ